MTWYGDRCEPFRAPRWSLLGVLLLCSLSVQCTLKPIPRDLTVYMNRDINNIAALEKIALHRYNAFTGENYISDSALRHSLATQIIPVYAQFVTLSKKIKPETMPVKKLHAIYRKAVTMRLQGLRTVMLAIDTQDPQLVRHANRMLDQGHRFVAMWRGRLAAMSGHYGLKQQ